MKTIFKSKCNCGSKHHGDWNNVVMTRWEKFWFLVKFFGFLAIGVGFLVIIFGGL